MKIVLCGGHNEADFLIRMFRKNRRNKLVVVNEDVEECKRLSDRHNLPVYCGNPSKAYALRDAGADGADVVIALSEKDADNLVICQQAKKTFGVKKCVCIVHNPKDVEIFRQLGVDSVISSTYLVAETIERASSVENLIKTLSVEDEKIVLTELLIAEDYAVVGKAVKDLHIPVKMNISCILRKDEVLIPDGQTEIAAGDTLVLISMPEDQETLVSYLRKGKAQ